MGSPAFVVGVVPFYRDISDGHCSQVRRNRNVLLRQDEEVGLDEALGEAIEGLGELNDDAGKAHAEDPGYLLLGVLLDEPASDELAVEEGEPLDTAFDIEDEDECVFEGADPAAGDPASADGFAEEIRGATDLHGGVEVAPEQILSVFSVKRPVSERLGVGNRLRFGELPADVVHGRGQ
jgi:hypothetical protein